MKYIVTKNDLGEEDIFLFSRAIDHDAFAEILIGLRFQTYGEWELHFPEPISAGFVSAELKCFGMSCTLGLQSRPVEDTKLLLTKL